MKSAPDSRRPEPTDLEAQLRRLHAHAVERVPGRILLQLRQRTPRAPAGAATRARPRPHAWPLAATCALLLVVGGLALRRPPEDRPAPATPTIPAVAEDGEPAAIYAALDESPELYLWLASTDDAPLPLE